MLHIQRNKWFILKGLLLFKVSNIFPISWRLFNHDNKKTVMTWHDMLGEDLGKLKFKSLMNIIKTCKLKISSILKFSLIYRGLFFSFYSYPQKPTTNHSKPLQPTSIH